ncbi:MAG: response regulator [Acidobacteria bacterium]|nr:response regulator [Acidobacteriota bacterium]
MHPIRVLLVDDDEDDYILARDLLAEIGRKQFTLDWASSYESALEQIRPGRHDLYLLDYRLGSRDGLELLRTALAGGCGEPVIVLTGHADRETDMAAMKAGASDYLVKGRIDAGTLERSIRYALERKRSQQELRQAKQSAEAANRAKSQFLANMSHEMRTPMTGVLGMLDLTLESELSATQRQHLEIARSSADSLLFLLNDILDFSKIEAGRLEVASIPFQLRRCVEEAVQTLAMQALAKGLGFGSEIDSEAPETLLGDPLRLRQILVNLVGNAVKFTDSGWVSLRVEVLCRGEAGVELRFAVTDTGIGIPKDKLEPIFDPFSQLDGSTTRRYGGTGLGLSISARLAELMGGRIRAESEPGRGSTFSFTARFRTDPAGAAVEPLLGAGTRPSGQAPQAGLARRRSLRILVAEDNPVNQKLVDCLLRKEGHQATIVASGVAAVSAARERVFDLILMDVQMPELDGLEATGAIRRSEASTGARVPIVAMTAFAMAEDRETCLRAGMDDYLTKPLSFATLRAMLEKWGACPVP